MIKHKTKTPASAMFILIIFSAFLAMTSAVIPAQATSTPSLGQFIKIVAKPTTDSSMKSYVDYKILQQSIQALLKKYPKTIEFKTYGKVDSFDLIKLSILKAKSINAPTILITAGIHGNETLGSNAALNFLEIFATNNKLKNNFNLVIYPATNPKALTMGRRRYTKDIDLNRSFINNPTVPEAIALAKDLEGHKFAMLLDLHGGPTRKHFFVIRSAEDGGLAQKSLSALSKQILLPSNSGTYPGKAGLPKDPERYSLPARGVVDSKLKGNGTLKSYAYKKLKTPLAYTLEYPMRNEPGMTVYLYTTLIESFFKNYEVNKQKPRDPKNNNK